VARQGRRAPVIFLRIASLVGIIAALAGIGVFVRDKDTHNASMLVFAAVACAILFAWSWRSAYLAPFEWARRYIQGVEGEHRHEWYAFRGYRVRVFLDADGQQWMSVDDIAPILGIDNGADTFRHYGATEYGTPDSAPGKCLSVSGLRRLIKYSSHRDAAALGLWLDREVLKVHGSLPSRETV
jgi:hypothetical protein